MMKMKRHIAAILLSLPTVALAQSVYMHEAQEDATSSEPISTLGLVVFAILVGIIYLIYKAISTASDNRQRKKNEARYEESQRQRNTIREGGFICPVCGKHVSDGNYEILWRSFERKSYIVKFCKSCGESYRRYEKEDDEYRRKERQGLPAWFAIVIIVLMVALGLSIFVMGCIRGEIFFGIIYMFITPIFIGAILGWVLQIFIKLFWNPKPIKPFEMPTFQHLKDCNALEERM